jgi:hypothetical protein
MARSIFRSQISDIGNLLIAGSSIIIESNGRISANVTTTTSLAGLTTANLAEGSNLYYTNARVVSAILPYLTTSNIAEGSNLYFTNTRVYSNVIALLPTLAGSGIQIQANGQINSNTSLTLASLSPFLTTSNVSEGTNLYYTNARVVSALTPYLTTSNVAEGSNLYYTNARVLSALTGNVTVGNLTATSIVIGTSVANSYTTAGNVTAGNVLSGNVTTTAIQANTWISLYTANVIETAGNLYFTNARVLAAVAGTSVLRQYVNTYKGNSQSNTIALVVAPLSNNYVTVVINGVTQLSNAYTVSGNVLTLSGFPATNVDIDVRILDVAQPLARDINSRLFYGNGSANTVSISNNFTDSTILVFENGIAQVPGVDYSASGGTLRFTTPPRANVVVEIRELPTLNGTQTYVGGQNIVVQANGQINATVQEQIHPFLLSLS